MARVDAEVEGDLDRLVELGLGVALDRLDRLGQRVEPGSVDGAQRRFETLAPACHRRHSTTCRPIERAEPTIIAVAASRSLAFMSFIFCSAISRHCATLICPASVRPGVGLPLSTLAARLMK